MLQQYLRSEDRVIRSFNSQNKNSFDLNSSAIKGAGESKMNELNTSNFDTTMINNISIDEGLNRNSIYKKSFRLKSIVTPEKPMRVEDITISSQDNE